MPLPGMSRLKLTLFMPCLVGESGAVSIKGGSESFIVPVIMCGEKPNMF